MTEAAQARHWREGLKLSRPELATLTGYSSEAIFLFEKGANSRGEPHPPEVWQRYKLACLAVATMRHYQVKSIEEWQWS
jgi:hypothetical protein